MDKYVFRVDGFKQFINKKGIEHTLKRIVFINNKDNENKDVQIIIENLIYSYNEDLHYLYISPLYGDKIYLDVDCDYLFAFMNELETIDVVNLEIDSRDLCFATEIFANCINLKNISFIKNLYNFMNNNYNDSTGKMGIINECNSLEAFQIEQYYLVPELKFLKTNELGQTEVKVDKYSLNRYISFRDLDKTVEVIDLRHVEFRDVNNIDNVSQIENIFIKCWHSKDKKTLHICPVSKRIKTSFEDNVSELFLSFPNLKRIIGTEDVVGFEDYLFENIDIK